MRREERREQERQIPYFVHTHKAFKKQPPQRFTGFYLSLLVSYSTLLQQVSSFDFPSLSLSLPLTSLGRGAAKQHATHTHTQRTLPPPPPRWYAASAVASSPRATSANLEFPSTVSLSHSLSLNMPRWYPSDPAAAAAYIRVLVADGIQRCGSLGSTKIFAIHRPYK